jgi:putative toxin-antitoxin system antitoxin component (TIGR02293 family)
MNSIIDQISQIKKGLTIAEMSALTSTLDITEKHLAKVVGLSISTLAIRKKAGRLKPIESERIMRVDRIFRRAMEVFDQNETMAKRWIKSPAKALGGIAPIDFTETDIGAREVENLLGRIEYGVYS